MQNNATLRILFVAIAFLSFFSCTKEELPELSPTADPVQAWAIPDVSFITVLNGDQQVPSVNSPAAGEAEVNYNSLTETLQYQFKASEVHEARGAYLHIGAAGTNGPAVARLNLESVPNTNLIRGEGSLGAQDLMDPFYGDIEGFARYLLNNQVYINIQTEAFPNGEIRGQLER